MNTRRHNGPVTAERGSAATTLVIALPVMIGIMGLAIDLGHVYARQTELQQVADSLALAAAGKLDGTKEGVTAALGAANALTHRGVGYDFGGGLVFWNSAALQLAARADAPPADWKDASTITTDAAAEGLVYAKVSSSKLDSDIGELNSVETFFMSVLGDNGTVGVNAVAVAGPAAVAVTPLAICALDASKPTDSRPNTTAVGAELIEYGFRRGVSYNLLDLSPTSTTPQAYLVNPLDPGTGSSNPLHFGAGYVGQFFCTGTVRLPLVAGGSKVHIMPMPGLPLADWLNSRFASDPASGCNATTAPVDSDIREYIGGYANWYMSTSPYPSTATSTDRNAATSPARVSVADLRAGDTSSVTPTVTSFGPLWVNVKPETTTGTKFSVTDWNKLYTYGGVSVPNTTTLRYGATGVPYDSTRHKLAGGGTKNRRVLNIPLLDCSGGAPASPATVLGVAKFFMTAKATASPAVIPGEFNGMLATNTPVAAALYK